MVSISARLSSSRPRRWRRVQATGFGSRAASSTLTTSSFRTAGAGKGTGIPGAAPGSFYNGMARAAREMLHDLDVAHELALAVHLDDFDRGRLLPAFEEAVVVI